MLASHPQKLGMLASMPMHEQKKIAKEALLVRASCCLVCNTRKPRE